MYLTTEFINTLILFKNYLAFLTFIGASMILVIMAFGCNNRLTGQWCVDEKLEGTKNMGVPKKMFYLDNRNSLCVVYDNNVISWDLKTKERKEFVIAATSTDEQLLPFSSCSISTGKNYLIAGVKGQLIVWETKTGECRQYVTGVTYHNHVAISSGGRYIAYSDNKYKIFIIDLMKLTRKELSVKEDVLFCMRGAIENNVILCYSRELVITQLDWLS